MNKESLKAYLNSKYKGCSSFLETIIFPIFGKDDFEDGYEAELLEIQPERKKLAEATGIRSIKQVGMFYVDVEPLQIFDITVSDHVMMERNRVNIQRLIRSVMDQFSCAFMIFHYDDADRWDWRFTYCRKGVNSDDSTDSKRYTFLLGPGQSCRTATDNFMKLFDKRGALEVSDIEEAFDVEALSLEFFAKYEAQYKRFVDYLADPNNGMREDFIDTDFDHTDMTREKIRDREEKPIRDYVKKLLGRIVFLHFLQKKGWMGVPSGQEWGNGDREFMLHLFQYATDTQKENFLDDILEDLFSEGLDRNRSDRRDEYDTEVKGFRNCRIPYLNGGLFERDELDKKPCRFPASYFGDLLEMLSQYNFTIDENDPNDAEVGIDPEMLGRIFENLLEDNKDLGVYYTPKEIVQYMSRESLIAYLQSDLQEEDSEKIRQFVSTHDADCLGDLKDEIEQRLCDVKICDPAIGSGAFPMGLLRELYFCRSAIEPNIVDKSADIKKHIIQNNIYGVDIEKGAVDIARLRFWLSLVVDEKSPEALPNLDFKIMQGNSLLENYQGIDLSKLATMSNVQIYEPQTNLFGEIEDGQMKMLYTQSDELQEFQKNLKAYFETTGHDERAKLRKKIDDYVRDIIEYNLDALKHSELQKIDMIRRNVQQTAKQQQALSQAEAEIERLEQVMDEVRDMQIPNNKFFLWHTYFNDVFSNPLKEGFDIVIGNPPYVKEYTNRHAFDGFRETSPYYLGKMDLWYGFACHGLDLLKPKGLLCFIAQNNWTTSSGAKKMRPKVIDDCQILQMLDFNTYMVFENADIQTMIMLFKRNDEIDNYPIDYRIITHGNDKRDMLALLAKAPGNTKYMQPIISWDKYHDGLLTFSDNEYIFDKISEGKTHLEDEEVAQGIVPNPDVVNSRNKKLLTDPTIQVGDGVFVVDKDKFSDCSKAERKYIKPLYEPYQMQRYCLLQENEKDLLYITKSNWKNDAPTLLAHLSKYKKIMQQRRENQNGRIDFMHLHWPRDERFFTEGEKILSVRKCVDHPTFVYYEPEAYVMMAVNVIKTSRWNMKFLTGVLNSTLIEYWLRHKGKMQGNNYQVDKEPLLAIPLPIVNDARQQKIIKLVDKILVAKKKDPEAVTNEIECEIDLIVYKLYGLTYDEVLIIDPTTPIEKEKYESYKIN